MKSHAYESVNRAWNATTKILLGEELGDIDDYKDWLTSNVVTLRKEKSAVSGKEVHMGAEDYCNGKFMRLDEVDFKKKFEPLNINEIKDIDGIVSALQERFCYTGDIILGHSQFVEDSTNVFGSHFTYNSNNVVNSKYIGYTSHANECEYMFGCNTLGETRYCIRNFETCKDTRCFELWNSAHSTDCHVVFGLDNCNDCMFSFNLRSASRRIGNLQLEKAKYDGLKKKLVAEIAQELKKKKSFPSLIDLVKESLKDAPRRHFELPQKGEKPEEKNKELVEDAFRKTTRIVLGRELRNMDDYAKYFDRHAWTVEETKSAISGKPVYLTHYISFEKIPRERIVKYDEAFDMGERTSMEESDLASQASIRKALHKVAFFRVESSVGENRNIIACPLTFHSSHAYGGTLVAFSKLVGLCTWPRKCDYTFGSSVTFQTSFVLNTYFSSGISRAFQVDCSRDCTDLYFSHNCEALQEGMFCFNVKNLKRAIGNAEYSPDDYKGLKSSLLEQISSELESKKTLKWDIYNIGCARESK